MQWSYRFFTPHFVFKSARLLLALVYYSLLEEGLWGASIGKRICGLRVARTTGVEAPGLNRAAGRALLYAAARHVPLLEAVVEPYVGPAWSPLLPVLLILLSYGLVGALFSTARRSNHLVAVHDLLTSTRVVMIRPGEVAHEIQTGAAQEATVPSGLAFGPYRAIRELPTGTGHLFVGYDDRLKRQVFIHTLEPAAPPVPVPRRRLLRAERLRWLGGARTVDASWDAYEAPERPGAHVAACHPAVPPRPLAPSCGRKHSTSTSSGYTEVSCAATPSGIQRRAVTVSGSGHPFNESSPSGRRCRRLTSIGPLTIYNTRSSNAV